MLTFKNERSALGAACISCCFVLVAGCGGGGGSTSAAQQTAPNGTTPSTSGDGGAATAPGTGVGSGGGTTGTTGTGSDGGTASTNPGNPNPSPTPAPAAPTHHRCGWIGGDTADTGAATFAANPDFFDAIHPVWFTANADGTVTANRFADDPRVVTVAKAHHVLLMPLIYGGDDGSAVRNIMSSPASIAAHVNTLVNLAVSRGYDGLEIDYEHLWQASDRPGYVALITALSAALHAKGKTVSLAISPQSADNGGNAYDYVALVKGGADVLHLMGYDYHSIDSDHTGPLAPLGWLDAVAARVQTLGIADHFILGVANYGVGHGWYVTSIAGAIAACGGTYSTVDTHMQSCPYGVWTAGTAPHCTTANGDLWFEDPTSVGEKARSAASHGLRGIAWYTLGSEPAGFFSSISAAYPQ